MKKTFAAALAAMMLLTAGTAMAAEFPNFDFNGDVKVHYRWNGGDGASTEGGKVWFRLNATSQLSDNVNVYARFATQKLTADNVGADFNQGYYSDDSATAIDRFGFVVKGKNATYNIGRQALTVGATGLLYSTEGYMGSRIGSIDGISVTAKSGVTDLKFAAGKQKFYEDLSDYGLGTAGGDNKLYTLRASYSPAKDVTVGATFGRVGYDELVKGIFGVDHANFWAADVSYAFGKAGFTAEYGKSNHDAENKAFVALVNYAFDNKNSAFVAYSKVEALADMYPGYTEFDNNGKGMYYGFDHKLRKDTTFSLFYKDMKEVVGGSKYNSLRTTLTYQF